MRAHCRMAGNRVADGWRGTKRRRKNGREEGRKNATPPFLINKCRYEASVIRIDVIQETDKYLRPYPTLFDVTSEYTPFTRIITIRKWTCANYFKRTTKMDRFRTDIFGSCNLWCLPPARPYPAVNQRTSIIYGPINTITEARACRWAVCGNIHYYRFARRLRHPQNHRARSLCAVIDDRLIRASTYKFSVALRPQPTSVAECDAMDS